MRHWRWSRAIPGLKSRRGPPFGGQADIFRTAGLSARQVRTSGITTCIAIGPSGHASSCDRPSQGHCPRHPNQDPSQDPSQGPGHGDSAVVPSGHASSVAAIARPSYYRGLRWQPQEAEGSVPLWSFRSHPHIPEPRFRPQIVCVTFVSTRFSMIRSSSRSTSDQSTQERARLFHEWVER